jgi:hypothetical protein
MEKQKVLIRYLHSFLKAIGKEGKQGLFEICSEMKIRSSEETARTISGDSCTNDEKEKRSIGMYRHQNCLLGYICLKVCAKNV